MDPLSFAVTVIILTATGALAPGPMFFVTIIHGSRSGPRTGITFSIAHTLVEFTLVMLLALGLLGVVNQPAVRIRFGIAGGIALLVFGVMQVRSSLHGFKESNLGQESTRSLFLMGLALTGLNPYFIIWWLTVGANLIFLSLEFAGLFGVVFMFVCHIWIDYFWLTLVASFAKKSAKIVNLKWYRLLMGVFGVILIYFSLSFLADALAFQ
jgi:threonine/homoserine/homoserine lactone efflux protein